MRYSPESDKLWVKFQCWLIFLFVTRSVFTTKIHQNAFVDGEAWCYTWSHSRSSSGHSAENGDIPPHFPPHRHLLQLHQVKPETPNMDFLKLSEQDIMQARWHSCHPDEQHHTTAWYQQCQSSERIMKQLPVWCHYLMQVWHLLMFNQNFFWRESSSTKKTC